MITVTVKEMTLQPGKRNLAIEQYNDTAHRLAQRIYKDLNNRNLTCPVCGKNNGTIIITSGEQITFSNTGFCHPEFASAVSFSEKAA